MLQGLPYYKMSFAAAGWLAWRWLFLGGGLITLALLFGCDTRSTPIPDDPAMLDSQQLHSSAQPSDTTSAPSTTSEHSSDLSQQLPRRENGRVFFPELGWVEEQSFWQMYNDAPESLPLSLDLYAAHQLRQEYEQEQMAGGTP